MLFHSLKLEYCNYAFPARSLARGRKFVYIVDIIFLAIGPTKTFLEQQVRLSALTTHSGFQMVHSHLIKAFDDPARRSN